MSVVDVGSLNDLLGGAPSLECADAEQIAHDHFGFEGWATPLTSERDQNVLITQATGRRIVLKIANAGESPEFLAAQQAALEHLAARGAPTPRVHGRTDVAIGSRGRRHQVWAINALDGHPLADLAYRTAELHRELGARIAAVNSALADFDHPAIHRDFHWDLAKARGAVSTLRDLVADDALRTAIDTIAAAFDSTVAPLLVRLPQQAVHGDANDNNVLVCGQHVNGIVDFGDMVYSYRVADLAIGIAYAMLGAADPLAVAAEIVHGYREHAPLTDDELAAVYGLACMRLCASACIAAEQQRAQPANAYLGVSQAAIRDALPVLAKIPFGLAQTMLREAAGVTPSPRADRVTAYLRNTDCAPVLGIDLSREPVLVLDLSIASPMLSGDTRENDEPHLTPKVFGAMREAGVRVGIGRYDEPRLLYVTPLFALGPKPTDEHRTVHIGLDLFAPAGTPVYAPLDGTIHAFANNDALLDYGPLLILRHVTDDGTEFFTLYGHLSRESLAGWSVGKPVRAGDQIATLGTAAENVGWTPHLHLQIITDLLGLGTDFPGVARPSQRSAWTALCPDPNLITRIPADRLPPATRDKRETLAERKQVIGGNLSIAYREPVKIARGWMQYLYDDVGRCYIDAYNNVPHVGHCHPRVVEAASAQMRVLSTNTRYLNDLLAAYAGKLLATLPANLEVCYFLNSASEANELALRLARAYTKQRDTIVLEAAYHGNTTSLIDISPYKHAGPGGEGAPDWVHVAPLPDVYRGPFKANDPQAGAKYAEMVGEIVDAIVDRARRPAAFIAETCPSVGGQLILPPGYLANVYEHVRKAGGVCIADEVQTGLGRMGTSFWAFEDQGVTPDIVVMGKPLGNGHPIGAVATTRAIAESFDNGMEFFSTFGGNTVSCAVGAAVLDVVRDEHLQDHALRVGEHLLRHLRALQSRYPIIGDVRGSGLFLGVELVRDRETLEPAGEEASFVANRMRELGVLLGTDGPYHNVVKIRPPMPFTTDDADELIAALDRALGDLVAR